MTDARDYSTTLFLPQTEFPMRAGLPQKEPELLARWEKLGLYARLREAAKGRTKFVLHDGPPFANGKDARFKALEKAYDGTSVVIWTTTPWTIPGNRAIAYAPKISYGLYQV